MAEQSVSPNEAEIARRKLRGATKRPQRMGKRTTEWTVAAAFEYDDRLTGDDLR